MTEHAAQRDLTGSESQRRERTQTVQHGRLEGKRIWVTGAGRGLGRAIACGIVRAGGTVIATSRSADTLESLREELGGDSVVVAAGSVTDRDRVDEIVADAVAGGGLAGVVNAAGISPSFERSERVDPQVFEDVLRTNTTGVFLCAQAVGRHLIDAGQRGAVVNVSSVHADVGYPRISAYTASKGAVAALTKTLAVEWADRGVRVNTLTPGYFPTDLSRGLLESRHGEELLRRIPMRRTGDPDELANAAVFMLSDESTYMTGADITIDGGWKAW